MINLKTVLLEYIYHCQQLNQHYDDCSIRAT